LFSLGYTTKVTVGFARLHIQGSAVPEQPFQLTNGSILVCNGEIFNSKILDPEPEGEGEGKSDCASIVTLLEQGLSLFDVARQLDGDFAIVLVNPTTRTIQMCRDPYGIRPLFYNADSIASELKGLSIREGLQSACVEPGTIVTLDFHTSETKVERWHQVPWLKNPSANWTHLEGPLVEAVRKRLATVRGIGACLSGGLDSSLVAALAKSMVGSRSLHTYSIGMEGSPDILFARRVADHIGSIHHERIITPEECIAVIPEVVRAIESFDITTVRASVGNYLLGQFILRETPDVKVILNGDGADEVFGGYLYMRAAPNDAAFESETTRLLTEIHRYDVLRSERCMAAHGLESRSPFLDRQLVSVARSIPTHLLRPTADRIEKWVVRMCGGSLLPDSVTWRTKEAFSDGISRMETSWFEMARAEGERRMAAATAGLDEHTTKYSVNPPKTAEAAWYRAIFHEQYSATDASVATPEMWMPRWVHATDPSARTLTIVSNQAV
jgi:asparagine synthase (glutamine-hydrolysing)